MKKVLGALVSVFLLHTPVFAADKIRIGFRDLASAHELFSFPVSGVIASAKNLKERPDEANELLKPASRPTATSPKP